MNLRKLHKLGILLCLLPGSEGFAGDNPQEAVFKDMAAKLARCLDRFEEEKQLDIFSEDFFRAVPRERLLQGLRQNGRAMGPIVRSRICKITESYAAEVELISQSGKRLRVALRLDPQPPHRIVHLVVGSIDDGQYSWEQFRHDLDQLPGQKSVCVRRIEPEVQDVFGYHERDALAVGSSFKLMLLATLVDQIAQRKKEWAQVVRLHDDLRSLPSGLLQDWPAGSPVTLHTLATLVASRSDNTAADHLIAALGRVEIEQAQANLGIGAPARNSPFLTTAEHFKLKLVQSAQEQQRYLAAGESHKRQILEELRSVKLDAARVLDKPAHIDRLEWFYSSHDLCLLLEHLRTSSQGNQVLPLLAITKPFDVDADAWAYLGFKGGAEIGVLNLSLLGKLKNCSHWYSLSLTWNRLDSPIDEPVWLRLLEKTVRLVERQATMK